MYILGYVCAELKNNKKQKQIKTNVIKEITVVNPNRIRLAVSTASQNDRYARVDRVCYTRTPPRSSICTGETTKVETTEEAVDRTQRVRADFERAVRVRVRVRVCVSESDGVCEVPDIARQNFSRQFRGRLWRHIGETPHHLRPAWQVFTRQPLFQPIANRSTARASRHLSIFCSGDALRRQQ